MTSSIDAPIYLSLKISGTTGLSPRFWLLASRTILLRMQVIDGGKRVPFVATAQAISPVRAWISRCDLCRVTLAACSVDAVATKCVSSSQDSTQRSRHRHTEDARRDNGVKCVGCHTALNTLAGATNLCPTVEFQPRLDRKAPPDCSPSSPENLSASRKRSSEIRRMCSNGQLSEKLQGHWGCETGFTVILENIR
jgi:hypothetical protein